MIFLAKLAALVAALFAKHHTLNSDSGFQQSEQPGQQKLLNFNQFENINSTTEYQNKLLSSLLPDLTLLPIADAATDGQYDTDVSTTASEQDDGYIPPADDTNSKHCVVLSHTKLPIEYQFIKDVIKQLFHREYQQCVVPMVEREYSDFLEQKIKKLSEDKQSAQIGNAEIKISSFCIELIFNFIGNVIANSDEDDDIWWDNQDNSEHDDFMKRIDQMKKIMETQLQHGPFSYEYQRIVDEIEKENHEMEQSQKDKDGPKILEITLVVFFLVIVKMLPQP